MYHKIKRNTTFINMTFTTPSMLNDEGCLLLSHGSFSAGLEAFKKALVAFKRQIQQGGSTEDSTQSQTNLSPEQSNGTCRYGGDFFAGSILAAASTQYQAERFWIYCRPLLMQGSGVADALSVSFNVALASHLLGVQQMLEGDSDAAKHSFSVAMNMYNFILRQINSDQTLLVNSHELLYAAIFNNLAHVHAALGEDAHAVTYAQQLLKVLFYFVDSGILEETEEISTHNSFMENAFLLTLKFSVPAAAA